MDKERSPCPFPAQYGGKDRCGVTEEDERDEVLMAVCAACATTVSAYQDGASSGRCADSCSGQPRSVR